MKKIPGLQNKKKKLQFFSMLSRTELELSMLSRTFDAI